jgi:hypothetical protein
MAMGSRIGGIVQWPPYGDRRTVYSGNVRTRIARSSRRSPFQGDGQSLPIQGITQKGGTQAIIQERSFQTLDLAVPGAHRLLALALVRSSCIVSVTCWTDAQYRHLPCVISLAIVYGTLYVSPHQTGMRYVGS